MRLRTRWLIVLAIEVVIIVLLYFFTKKPLIGYIIGIVIGSIGQSFLLWGFSRKLTIEKTTTDGDIERKITIEGSSNE